MKNLSCLPVTEPMPVVFVGHGNPMNAIEINKFSEKWTELGLTLPRPKAILCVSAHWETSGTRLTAMSKPPTIHDFGGFPRELYEVNYPTSGFPELAEELILNTTNYKIQADFSEWGLDHGSWSVLRNMYPNADIPVIQMSLNKNMTPQQHFELAEEIAFLRYHGVLVIGSGNIVHNLRMIDWQNQNSTYEWAQEFNEKTKLFVLEGNNSAIHNLEYPDSLFRLSVPTIEHFLPLLYVLGAKKSNDKISIFNDEIILGSLSMTGFVFL